MKKTIATLLLLAMLTGCGSATEQNSSVAESKAESTTVSEMASSTEAASSAESIAVVETKSKILAPTLYSESLGLDWNYSIYLPSSYNEEGNTDEYPVLFLMHGAYGNHRNLIERFPIQEQLDTLVEEKKLDETIVVFVDGFNSFYINGPTLQMEDAIVDDLIPHIDTTYRVKAGRENHSIGGISMGGYGSANLALAYPDLFSNALLISPAIWENLTEETVTADWMLFRDDQRNIDAEKWTANHPLSKLDAYSAQENKVNFFIITGDADVVVPLSEVENFSNKLNEIASVEVVVLEGGVHAWTTWEGATKQSLEFLGTQELK